MRSLNFKNKWVLVTGASSGLGQEMALQLASKEGANLIITARRADRLEQLRAELVKNAGVQVKIIVADISTNADVDRIIKESTEGQELYAAILNAGITYFGEHKKITDADFDRLIQTNVTGVVRMATQLVKYFEENGREGGVMTVTSMATLYPVPYQALYSGSKAFITNFMLALSQELTNKDLSLTVFAPSGIETEMTQDEKFGGLKKWLMPVSQAALEGIQSLKFRKLFYIPGALNRNGSRFMKLLPRRFILSTMAKTYRKSLGLPH
ncbi:SDR family NAD(P)-dependent oxidoreductase [Terrimonas sp. NA20]|uniref:SDR family NAD(P)-dependent oxidoreductase n=1 Tax=Terrimonas ginsenosidimutans TaxID=2908004 RepID=A0ABS9KLX3_9BACT|nr:SDR family NAD(P)-dependent oxidoreductase [Terrimonas ginsenosidimutans]MCG2613321.1 SDR family NAD(P)-dependent oxidoreductase [Terrimonas ginsenosidimutans]